MNRLHVDLALSGLDQQAASKAFLEKNSKSVEERVASFIPKNKIGSDQKMLGKLVSELLALREAADLAPVQQQAALVKDLRFECLPAIGAKPLVQAVFLDNPAA